MFTTTNFETPLLAPQKSLDVLEFLYIYKGGWVETPLLAPQKSLDVLEFFIYKERWAGWIGKHSYYEIWIVSFL